MSKKLSKLQLAQLSAESALKATNDKIGELGIHTGYLNSYLSDIQSVFDKIRNIPDDKRKTYEKIKKQRLKWKEQAEKIEKDYNVAAAKNAAGGLGGVSLGVGVVTMGPTVAMGVATTFGVASTGTAISALSGAAATNAALAWLGGGALAAGGGGMAAGEAFLALAGPVGWAIAGVAVLASGIFFLVSKKDKDTLDDLFTRISQRDIKSYQLALVEINERIARIIKEGKALNDAMREISTYGLDYDAMSEDQQYNLGTYFNLMEATTQLLVNPILGLQPKFTKSSIKKYVEELELPITSEKSKFNPVLLSLANLLNGIEINSKEKKLLRKSLHSNKDFLKSMKLEKKDMTVEVIEAACKIISYQETNVAHAKDA